MEKFSKLPRKDLNMIKASTLGWDGAKAIGQE